MLFESYLNRYRIYIYYRTICTWSKHTKKHSSIY